MRIVLLSTAAIALSGCSWLGLGGHAGNTYNHANSYGTYKAQPAKPCCNGQTLSRWNAELGVGQEFLAGGTLISGDANGIAGVNPAEVSMKNAFEVGDRFDMGVSYALNPNRKVVLNGHVTSFDGERQFIGTQDGQALNGNITDFQTYGLEAGLRQYILPVAVPVVKSVRPYVEGRIGASHVDDINITGVTRASAAGAPTASPNFALYDSGWVPTAAGLVGVETPLFNRMTVGVETGLRYSGKLDRVNGGFAGDNGGGNWTIPVSLRGRYRF